MDVPAAAAGPWIVLGAVLGALLLLAVGATVLRLRPPSRPGPAPAPPPTAPPRDDLADFLAHPPGSHGVPDDDVRAPLAPLAPLAPPPPAPVRAAGVPTPPPGRGPAAALAGLAVAALLLVGTAAALAAAQRTPAAAPDAAPGTPTPTPTATTTSAASSAGADGREGAAARLAFGGVVLEEHAVGITAAYPELELTADGEGRALARLRLPTANCLAAVAPPLPGDPGCRPARTEYAELAAPDLRVERDGDRLTVSGRFATSLRPPGGPAERTGRSYEVVVTVTAAGAERAGWRAAEGELRWEDQRAGTRTDGTPSVLRAEG